MILFIVAVLFGFACGWLNSYTKVLDIRAETARIQTETARIQAETARILAEQELAE